MDKSQPDQKYVGAGEAARKPAAILNTQVAEEIARKQAAAPELRTVSNKAIQVANQEMNIKMKAETLNNQALQMLASVVCEGDHRKKYHKMGLLGKGAYGQVYRGYEFTGRQVAIKVQKFDRHAASLYQEVALLKRCQHENITQYVASYLLPQELWIIMEYVDGMPLSKPISKFCLYDEEIAAVTQGTLKALHYLHTRGIMHRDVKSDNVMVSKEGVVKLTDFGSAVESATGSGMVGTLWWLAPEVLCGRPYDNRVDVWALGITVIEMVKGPEPHPYAGLDVLTTAALIRSREPEIPACTSPQIAGFLDCCLAMEPESRMSPATLMDHSLVQDCYAPKHILSALVTRTNERFVQDSKRNAK
jgi:p21-activated kinase 1